MIMASISMWDQADIGIFKITQSGGFQSEVFDYNRPESHDLSYDLSYDF